jgi:peptide/nickel transport system substrate-binding protein
LQHQLLAGDAVAAPLYVQQYQRAFADTVGGYVDNPAYPNVTFVHELRPTG